MRVVGTERESFAQILLLCSCFQRRGSDCNSWTARVELFVSIIGLSRKGSPLRCTSRNWVGKVGSKSAARGGTAAPPPKVGNWTGFAKKNPFFSLRKSTENIFLATYYWVQSPTYTKIWWSYWWSYEVLWWSCNDCSQTPPTPHPEVGNWTGFTKKKFIFCHSENQMKKKFSRRESPSVGPEANPSSFVWATVYCIAVTFILKQRTSIIYPKRVMVQVL